jgi:hypothetical protein
MLNIDGATILRSRKHYPGRPILNQYDSRSMGRLVGVKSILLSFRETTFVLPPSGHCRHASIRTLAERLVRSVQVGRFRFSRCCHLFIALWFCSCSVEPGQAIHAVTGTRLWAFAGAIFTNIDVAAPGFQPWLKSTTLVKSGHQSLRIAACLMLCLSQLARK